MVTRILFDPRRDLTDGTTSSSAVTLEATPTGVREDGSVVVLPSTLSFTVNTAADLVQLAAPAASWAWRLVARQDGVVKQQRTVRFTDVTSVKWAELVDVDPDTLGETDGHARQWDATFFQLVELIASATGDLASLKTRLDAITANAPGAFDTFLEVATQLGLDETTVTTLTALVAGKEIAGLSDATRASLSATYQPLMTAVQAQRYSTTTGGTQALAQSSAAPFGTLSTFSSNDVVVNPDERFQHYRGVGAALTGSAMVNLTQNMTASQRHDLLVELFSPDRDNWSTLRITIGASDFENFPYSQNYTYDDMPAGYFDSSSMPGFSLISRDTSITIPLLQEILAINPGLRIIASIWHLPDWMINYSTQNFFIDSYSQQLANYLLKYVQAMRSYGIPIYGISLKNEPLSTGYTYFTTAQQIALIGTYIGPLFATNNIQTRIFLMDDNWSNSAYAQTVLADPTAASYVDSIAWHGYSGAPSVMSPIRKTYPNVNHHMTELRTLQVQGWAESMALMAGKVMVNGFRNWLNTVTLWNLALDTDGLPTQSAPGRRGVVTIAKDGTGTVTRNAEYYALTHASKFLREGAVRIASTSSPSATAGVQSVAWQNLDGSIVLYLFNPDGVAATFQISDAHAGKGFPVTLAAGELATFVWGTSSQASPAGSPATFTVPAAPTATVTAGAGQATISWTLAAQAAPVTQWALYRGTTAGTENLLTLLPAPTTNYVDLVGASGTVYYRVAGINLVGTGAQSPSAAATLTAPAAPDVPVASISPNAGYNLVYWPAPSANGSPLLTYKVYRGTTAGTGTLIATIVAKGTVGYADSGAPIGSKAYYTVTATNAVGTSSASNEVSGTAYSQVAFDAASSTPTVSGAATAVNTTSWSHTTGTGAKRLLLVAVATTGGTGGNPAVTAVTYGAQSLTRVNGANSPIGGTERLVDLWMLVAPASGTATITATLNAGVTATLGGSAATFVNVNQSTPVGTSAVAAGASVTSLAPTVTGQDSHDIVFSAAVVRGSAQPTLGTGQTAVGATQMSSNAFVTGSRQAAVVGAVTTTFTVATADAGAAVAVPILNG